MEVHPYDLFPHLITSSHNVLPSLTRHVMVTPVVWFRIALSSELIFVKALGIEEEDILLHNFHANDVVLCPKFILFKGR